MRYLRKRKPEMAEEQDTEKNKNQGTPVLKIKQKEHVFDKRNFCAMMDDREEIKKGRHADAKPDGERVPRRRFICE